MASQHESFKLMLEAISAMREAGFTHEDLQDLLAAAFDHLEGVSSTPYAFGRCAHCNRWIIGWSPYQWSALVRAPCPKCGEPW